METLLEGPRNTLLCKHCREIRQTIYLWKVTRVHQIVLIVIGLGKSCCYLQKSHRLVETIEFSWWKAQYTDWTCIVENLDYCYSACLMAHVQWFLCFIKTFINYGLYVCFVTINILKIYVPTSFHFTHFRKKQILAENLRPVARFAPPCVGEHRDSAPLLLA